MSGPVMNARVKKVVVAGRDIAAWLSALTLTQALGRADVAVEVVELPSVLREHDIAATLPAMEAFHRLLGLREYELMKAAAGTYSLGQSFANFTPGAEPFFHPYGSHGVTMQRVPFMQMYTRARKAGLNTRFEDFSLTAAAAKQGRFFAPTQDMNGFATSGFGYHLRARAYADHLKARAIREGAVHTPARRFEARRHAETGDVTALVLGDGREVTGDVFIDASGTEAALLGAVMDVAYQDWSDHFAGNSTLSVSSAPLRSQPAWSQVRALKHGYLTLAPLQTATSLVLTYNDRLVDDATALRSVAIVAGMTLNDDAVVGRQVAGRRAEAWAGNVIAIGEAACLPEGLDNVALHVAQLGLVQLVSLFPAGRDMAAERGEYNANMARALERLRDFQLSHYKLNRLFDAPFFAPSLDRPAPALLAHKIEMFRARGIVPMYDDESFDLDSWQSVFLGHGLLPDGYDPRADLMPDDQAVRNFQLVLGRIKAFVQDMDSHEAFIETHCAAV